MDTNLSNQTRTNAAIAYFFLGFLFLLATNNPNFSEPFVRAHAKKATKIHFGFFGYIFLHKYFLSQFLLFSLPIVNLSLDRTVFMVVIISFFAVLANSARKAFLGQDVNFSSQKEGQKENLDTSEIWSEAEIVRTLLAFVPFVSPFIAERKQTKIILLGERISSLALVILLCANVFLSGDNVFLIGLFLYTFLFVTVGALLLSGGNLSFLQIFDCIPSLEVLAQWIRTLPRYTQDVIETIALRREHLDFHVRLSETIAKEKQLDSELQEYFNGESGAFSPYLIYIPIVNFIYLPRFFFSGRSPYVLAIGQGITLSLLVITMGYIYGITSPLLSLALLPMSIGLATVKTRPLYRILGIYELYSFLSFVTFWFISGTKKIHKKHREEKSVSYKV